MIISEYNQRMRSHSTGQAAMTIESLLLRLLPKERLPLGVSYAGTTAVVAIAAAFNNAVAGGELGRYPLLLFFPAVFLCSLLFDRACGVFATMLSAVISAYVFVPPKFSFAISVSDILALLIFILIGCSMAVVIEALRRTVTDLIAAESAKSLLLEELAHRTKNDLAIIGSSITLQARASSNPEVRSALDAANARLQVVASAQSKLKVSATGARVSLAEYLEALCSNLGDMLRDIRPIAVRVHCPAISVPDRTAVSIGLIVNELVTNSMKYAFPSDSGGIVDVTVSARDEGGLTIKVRDNGSGCREAATGLGTRLVGLLAKQHGGHFERTSDATGCEAIAVIPDLR
jgi:two-component sensor histidine kinase